MMFTLLLVLVSVPHFRLGGGVGGGGLLKVVIHFFKSLV